MTISHPRSIDEMAPLFAKAGVALFNHLVVRFSVGQDSWYEIDKTYMSLSKEIIELIYERNLLPGYEPWDASEYINQCFAAALMKSLQLRNGTVKPITAN
jgi:hypothetical protein